MPVLLATACCWVPAYALLKGLVSARPPKFAAPGALLRREDAPSLFAVVDELALAARTPPPDDVYLSALPTLFVTETGRGLLGLRSRRVLCIGAPYLDVFSVGEMRSVLAHELGHYVGGDTKLGGVLAYTEGAFRSVLLATSNEDGASAGTWLFGLGGSPCTRRSSPSAR